MILIRPARENDVPAMYGMLRASAIDQNGLDKLCVNPENLRVDGFGANPRFQCLIAEIDGIAAGLALYFHTYSTWNSRDGIYLEDLYVEPEFRRRGIARYLIAELANLARQAGARRMQWLVLRNNEKAIRFYESIGAHAINDEVNHMWLDPGSAAPDELPECPFS